MRRHQWGWQLLIGGCVSLGLIGVVAPVTASQQECRVSGQPVRLYQLSGRATHLRVQAQRPVVVSAKTRWVRIGQMTVTQAAQATSYVHVRNLQTGLTGWVPADRVHAVSVRARDQSQSKAKQVRQRPVVAPRRSSVPISRTEALRTSDQTEQTKTSRAKVTRTRTESSHATTEKETSATTKQSQPKRRQVTSQKARSRVAQSVSTRHPATTTRRSRPAQSTRPSVIRPHRSVQPAVKTKPADQSAQSGTAFQRIVQQQPALIPPRADQFKIVPLVGNGRYTTKKQQFRDTAAYLRTGGFQTQPDVVRRQSGYLDQDAFKTACYLPMSLDGRGLNDPQSATFSADDRYLYVLYVDSQQAGNGTQTGWVVRYDWQRLMQLGAGTPGKMALLRLAAAHQREHRLTALDREVLACIKVGPKFNSGHAQSLNLNPASNQLWFIQDGDRRTSTVERLDPETLTPNASVQFRLGSGVKMGIVLTFNRQGRAYFWTHQQGATAQAPAGTVRLYRGTISTAGVQFEQLNQGLAFQPGYYAQSMGYSPTRNRLYLVSDGSITSVPVSQLGHLTTKEIGESNYADGREFEGLVFMHHSPDGFLLTSRGVELMRMVPAKTVR